MSLIFVDQYEPTALNAIIFQINSDGSTLHLYQNNYVPVDASVLGNFTEATFSGYADAVIAMQTPAEVAGKAVSIDLVARTFTHNGGGTANTVYGYYVYDPFLGKLIWAERFAAPISMSAIPDIISIQLQLTLDSMFH